MTLTPDQRRKLQLLKSQWRASVQSSKPSASTAAANSVASQPTINANSASSNLSSPSNAPNTNFNISESKPPQAKTPQKKALKKKPQPPQVTTTTSTATNPSELRSAYRRNPAALRSSSRVKGQSESGPSWRENAATNARLHSLQVLNKRLSDALHRSKSARTPIKSEHAFIDETPIHDFEQRLPNPALAFPFQLDPFQKRAILQVEQQQNVFVAAHTSAGKTVVAEYAIALGAETKSKVFYTSPIKTLSNQKYRDFRNKFEDVGLVTGDVSINDTAQCVIMTTEILRSMLYRGADAINELSYVIFDEVQYLNDKERGVVWEESIIMLPEHVTIIMLSATVPNALEFATWVGVTRNNPVAVVYTDKRPVPLQHSLLHLGTDGLTSSVIIKSGGDLDQAALNRAVDALHTSSKQLRVQKTKEKRARQRQRKKDVIAQTHIDDTTTPAEGDNPSCDSNSSATQSNFVVNNAPTIPSLKDDEKRKQPPKHRNVNKGSSTSAAKAILAATGNGPGTGRNVKSSWSYLVDFLEKEDQMPAVVFIFSKKKCEAAVQSLANHDLLPNKKDKNYVQRFFDDAVQRLSESDRELPQVVRAKISLQTGLAAHHAGLLPIVKEVTEILFSKGLVKVLFATETFAMGVNMPARTAIFSGLMKNDGRSFRYLESGEYTQMSGRAGRRGIDKVGNVNLYFNEADRKPNVATIKKVLTGIPTSLKSAFRLTYNMILNVLRVHELEVEEMMMQSFSEAKGQLAKNSMSEVYEEAQKTLIELVPQKKDIEDDSDTEISSDEANSEKPQPPENGLKVLGEKYARLRSISNEIDSSEHFPAFYPLIQPGRLVIVELQPGQLVLAVVFSIVSNGKKRPNDKKVKANPIFKHTRVWIAGIMNVADTRMAIRIPSILLLPASIDSSRNSNHSDPVSYTTREGLHVSLSLISVQNIMYICDSVDPKITTDRIERQNQAAANWHFGRSPYFAVKCLRVCAEHLQSVVQTWDSQGVDKAFRCHLDEVTKVSTKERERTLIYSKRQRSRVLLCKEMIRSTNLYELVLREACNGFTKKLQEMVLEGVIKAKMEEIKTLVEGDSNASLLPEYKSRVKVLQALDYVGEDEVSVLLKGRCGAEVSCVNSIVLTEIIFDNVLHGLGPAEVASLLSSFVCRVALKDKGRMRKESGIFSGEYLAAKEQLESIVQKVGAMQKDCGVELSLELSESKSGEYLDAICKWDLALAVYRWIGGCSFCEVATYTEQQEGDIVVCMKRLCEVMKDAQSVAKKIGNDELHGVLEVALTQIRRDVMFNGSLYFDEDTR